MLKPTVNLIKWKRTFTCDTTTNEDRNMPIQQSKLIQFLKIQNKESVNRLRDLKQEKRGNSSSSSSISSSSSSTDIFQLFLSFLFWNDSWEEPQRISAKKKERERKKKRDLPENPSKIRQEFRNESPRIPNLLAYYYYFICSKEMSSLTWRGLLVDIK